MKKGLATAALACAAGLMALSAAGAANAAMHAGPAPRIGTAHMGHMGHGPVFHGHHHFHPGFVFGIGDGYYVEDDYGGCGYYRVRWHETGSRYWRARYLDCVEG